ncbi:hypothetical protein [Actinomyces vulturis]|uniref:hypothetical protein n=1 Tax=Actinomyces vulturis TaxID=1857645 RepID=UPI00082AF8BB|nr:hypothetical protein [Actinomyces vulturis]
MSNFDESKVNRQSDGKFGFKAAGRPAASLDALGNSFEDHADKVRDCGDEQMAVYATYPDAAVRYEVAVHGKDVHREMLMSDTDVSVLSAVAKNGNSSQVNRLFDHENKIVRGACAYNADERLLQYLAKDKEPYVRSSVARNTKNMDLLARLENDKDESVRRSASVYERLHSKTFNFENADKSELFECAQSPDHTVRYECAKYGDEEVLSYLSTDDNAAVRSVVAQRGSDELRWELVDDPDYMVKNAVAKYGNKQHRNHMLANNPSWLLRSTIEDLNRK